MARAAKPKIDDLVYAITPDATARYAKLQGQRMPGDGLSESGRSRSHGQGRQTSTCMQQAGLNIGYLAMNVQKPPFDKSEVRKAIAMAIDRDSILKEVYQGAGQKAKNPIPPTIWSYDDTPSMDYEYNPDKAKEMLKAAGVDNLRPICGGCRCNVPTIPMPSAWRR